MKINDKEKLKMIEENEKKQKEKYEKEMKKIKEKKKKIKNEIEQKEFKEYKKFKKENGLTFEDIKNKCLNDFDEYDKNILKIIDKKFSENQIKLIIEKVMNYYYSQRKMNQNYTLDEAINDSIKKVLF